MQFEDAQLIERVQQDIRKSLMKLISGSSTHCQIFFQLSFCHLGHQILTLKWQKKLILLEYNVLNLGSVQMRCKENKSCSSLKISTQTKVTAPKILLSTLYFVNKDKFFSLYNYPTLSALKSVSSTLLKKLVY